MYQGSVKAPKRKAWAYWLIRATSKEDPERVRWVCQNYGNRYRLYTDEAKKYEDLPEAVRVCKYLQKRGDAAHKWHDLGGMKYEVVKIVVDKKIELEYPLGILEKLAKV